MKKKIWRPLGLLLLIGMILTMNLPILASENPYSLTIHSNAPEDIEFTIWQVDTSNRYIPATTSDARKHLLTNSVRTETTNNSGEIVFSSLPAGIYYVEESGSAVLKDNIPCEAFLVSVPMEEPDGNGEINNVHVYPKSQSLLIDKFVGEAGGADYDFSDWEASKYLPVAVGASFGWSILSSIPFDIGSRSGEEYSVTDVLNRNFKYVHGSVKIYAVSATDTLCRNGTPLAENSDYILSFDDDTNTLKVILTASGMTLLRGYYEDVSVGVRFLLIKFDCQLKDNAPQGVQISNGAMVKYIKSRNTAVSTVTMGNSISAISEVAEEPAVHTGQIGITKVDAGNKGKTIAGAEFGVAHSKEAALNGNFIATGTTNEVGNLVFKGLSYGKAGDKPLENTGDTTYWLVETKSPEGYTKLEEPIEVVFNYQQDKATGEYYFAKVMVYNKQTVTSKTARTGDVNPLQVTIVLLIVSLITAISIIRRKIKKSV